MRELNDGCAVDRDSLDKFERRIGDLISACQRLKGENETLKAAHSALSQAHDELADKTRRARDRIELMINRLKALERS